MESIVWILLIAALVAVWQVMLRARERALAICTRECQRHGLQLLDQTVTLTAMRPVWQRGRFHWERRYHFEFTLDGEDRQPGTLSMQGIIPVFINLPGISERIISPV